MSTDKLISIVGHSLVPHSIGSVSGSEIRIFRSPGAKASGFDSNQALSSVLNWTHDLTILFLGGNDINDHCIPSKIATDLQNIIQQIHTYCNSCIAVVLIENRNPPANNRFNVTAVNYKRIASNVNSRLKRFSKNKSYVKLVSVGAKPFQNTTDGVHFDNETKGHLIQKFRNTIRRFIDCN